MCSGNNMEDFLDRLASKSPVPGGGGASSLAGAIGISLGSMVGNLTVGKKKYVEYEEELKSLLEECSTLQTEFLELIQKDAEVFEPLSKAYGLPRDTDEEKETRVRILEDNLNLACSVPMEIMQKCIKAIDLHERLGQIGTKIAISDIGVGVVLCQSALKGASLNVFINTKLMKDREKAISLNNKANEMLLYGNKKATEIFSDVENQLK